MEKKLSTHRSGFGGDGATCFFSDGQVPQVGDTEGGEGPRIKQPEINRFGKPMNSVENRKEKRGLNACQRRWVRDKPPKVI